MNTSQLNNRELEKKYPPLEIPQILRDLIESRRKCNYRKVIAIIIWLTFIFLMFLFFFELVLTIKILGFSFLIAGIIAYFVLDKNGRAAKAVINQVGSRKNPNEQEYNLLWRSRKKVDIAQKINNICIELIPWDGYTVFLPEDPFCLMIELYTGDLCEVEAIMAIEEEFSLKFPKEYFNEENPGDLKFKNVVDYIIRNSSVSLKVKRKRLKGIASGLVGKFISRNNDIDGYWGLGILYKVANDSGKDNFKLDILSVSSSPHWRGSKNLANKYKNFLIEQLGKNGLTESHILKAVIEMDFDSSHPVANKPPKCTWGEPYRCRAVITDDLHEEHSCESYGWCGIHNSRKELKSSRTRK